ncbi:MAG: hypothetical protein ACI3VN_07515 [Candidatus Onthomonas sp.]
MAGICFFIGHRDTAESIKPALYQAIEHLIAAHGVTEFMVGRYGSFDRLAARAVIDAKARYQGISLTLLLPYYPTKHQVVLPDGFDDSFYPPGMESVPKRLAIVRANHSAVDCAQYLIACVWHPASNAYELLQYAEKRALRGLIQVENLGIRFMEQPEK